MQGIDVFALLLGLVMLFVLIFAGIGKYARRVNGGGAPAEKTAA
jgi:hypothetical protein